ncbi:MAG: hypothetical protein IPF60_17000 [Betaproteobacteria bacterium]|nr:hypothetical protein [Betaproteobacteria bacterium]
MTALLLSVGETPHLYVYGDASSSDVRVAKNIALGERLELDHVDKGAFAKVTPEQFVTSTERDFYFFDGIKPLGQMDDGSDMTTRLSRARKARLQLNGAGGEIYREIWNLSDRSIDLESFLKLRYDRGDYSYLKRPFDSQSYFSGFAEKVRHKLAMDRRLLTRKEAEMLFPSCAIISRAPTISPTARFQIPCCHSWNPALCTRVSISRFSTSTAAECTRR